MACQTEINGLPILTGCPADTEVLLVMNATAAGNTGGYGLRYIKDVRQCWLQKLVFGFLQFTVGQGGSPISVGDTVITIDVDLAIEDSVNVILEGAVLDRDDDTQVSYTVAYSPTQIVITLNQGASNNQTYIITYTYAT